MRVAVATVSHETNTFASGRTTLEDFETADGADLLASFDEGRSLAGIVDVLREDDIDIVPTVGMSTLPSPTVSRTAFDAVRDDLVAHLADASIDGICLDLHGSMYVEDQPDPEGELLSAVRDVVGPSVPITAALDMHATVTETMIRHLDGVAAYRTAPHTDVVETGERAAETLVGALRGEVDLTLSWGRIPMILAGERSETGAEPMATLADRLRETEATVDGVVSADYLLGFPWADSPHAGCHALVTGDANALAGDEGTDADGVAGDLASAFWERRHEFGFTTEAHRLDAALDEAADEPGQPVVVADTGDIPGAGASEDVTNSLRAVLERDDLGTPVVAVVADEASLERCLDAAPDEPVSLSLGRRVPSDDPLPVTGTAEATSEVQGVRAALVSLDGADVVVTDSRTNHHRDPSYLRQFGVDPTAREVIVLKSGYLSPAWKTVAARRLFALTPGDTNQLIQELPYESIPRPIYPIDADTGWSR